MRGYVSRVIEPEEYASMSNDELFNLIQKGEHYGKRKTGTHQSFGKKS